MPFAPQVSPTEVPKVRSVTFVTQLFSSEFERGRATFSISRVVEQTSPLIPFFYFGVVDYLLTQG